MAECPTEKAKTPTYLKVCGRIDGYWRYRTKSVLLGFVISKCFASLAFGTLRRTLCCKCFSGFSNFAAVMNSHGYSSFYGLCNC